VQNDLGFCNETFVFLNDRAWSEAFGHTNQNESAKALAGHCVLVKDGKHFKTKTPRSVGTREHLFCSCIIALHLSQYSGSRPIASVFVLIVTSP
jgi:hypothetical protein